MQVISQALYPYTAFGAWVYSAGFQVACGGQGVVSGWYPAPVSLMTMLVRHGLPATSPAAVGAAAEPPGSPAFPQPIWLVGLAAALAAVLAGLAAASRQRRVRAVVGGRP
jgi:hypothetical protein